MRDTLGKTLFAPVAVPTLRHDVLELVTAAIFRGTIKAGERLNETRIARELGLSRAPIREALLRLQEQGMVINNPRRGMFVIHLEDSDVDKINGLRVLLEGEALRACRGRLDTRAEARLERALERLERAETAAPDIRARLDFDLHRAIWKASGNEYLERTLNGLAAPLFAHSVLRFMQNEEKRHLIRPHRPLLDYAFGLSNGCPEALVAEHLRVPWPRPE